MCRVGGKIVPQCEPWGYLCALAGLFCLSCILFILLVFKGSMQSSHNLLDVVSPRGITGPFFYWRFCLSVIIVVPHTSLLVLSEHISLFPYMSVSTSVIRAKSCGREGSLGDCDVLDICLQIYYVQFKTSVSIHHCDFSQMDGWTNI